MKIMVLRVDPIPEVEDSDLEWVQNSPMGGFQSLIESQWTSTDYLGDGHPRSERRLKENLAAKPIWEQVEFWLEHSCGQS